MEIYLIRHGETVWNLEGRFQGSKDIPLAKEGRDLAIKTAERIRDISFDYIFSSPLSRAFETAELVTEKRQEIIKDTRLREISFGIFEGELVRESKALQAFIKDPVSYGTPENGEAIEDLLIRTKDFLETVVKPLELTCERILIVSHGGVIASIMCNMKGLTAKDFWSTGLSKNCGINIIELTNGNYTIKQLESMR